MVTAQRMPPCRRLCLGNPYSQIRLYEAEVVVSKKHECTSGPHGLSAVLGLGWLWLFGSQGSHFAFEIFSVGSQAVDECCDSEVWNLGEQLDQ